MIEINLLPMEQRQTEGTPMPRLGSIIGGAVIAVVGAIWIAKYYVVEIPRAEQDIATKQEEKKRWELKVQETEQLRTEINKIQQKVSALRNLERSRIRWARLLFRFRRAIPEHCVIKTFSITKEASTGSGPAGNVSLGAAKTGERYKVSLAGITAGTSQQECSSKLTEIVDNLNREFEVVRETNTKPTAPIPVAGAPGAPPVDPRKEALKDYDNFLGLRFEEPSIVSFQHSENAPNVKVPDELKESYNNSNPPDRTLTFTMTVAFSLPPPEQANF